MSQPTLKDQAAVLIPQLAGYVGARTIGMGLRTGLLAALSGHPEGATADELAEELGYDPFYVGVWARSAIAAAVCDRAGGDRLRLAAHMDTLLLDPSSPAALGGGFTVLARYEAFDRFEEHLADGRRMWWDDTSPGWIDNVSRTGTPFYVRLVPAGLHQVPGLAGRLAEPATILETACGAGVGVVRLAETYPQATVVGADGDAHSLQVAEQRVAEAGVADRVELIQTPLEGLDVGDGFALAINNISMHECRDIDRATANIRRALEPGGWFVISDFPFPRSDEGLRTGPGRVMSGIQFFEAQIDDQLLPRSAYDDLLARHGFRDRGHSQLASPLHALTWGRA